MLTHFWNQWRKEYVTSLREHQRYLFKGRSRTIQLNDIVIVFDEKCPRHLWRTAKVEKLLHGGDGCIRGAEVKLSRSGNRIRRPVSKLYPLVTETENSDIEDKNESIAARNLIGETDIIPSTDTKEVSESRSSKRSPDIEKQGRHGPRRVAAIVGEIRRKQAVQ